MSRISYVGGRYVDHHEAFAHIEDRGYQFADGVYEYFAFYNRKIVDELPHLKRLERSLAELQIAMPMSIKAMQVVMRELIARNGREDGGIYLQVTRGVARRDHAFPKDVKPVLAATLCAAKIPTKAQISAGVKVITQPDIRWERCDIKSLSLLGNVLAKQQAALAGARETWLVHDDYVTEGSASNTYIINPKGELITHPATHAILGGITRDAVLKLARAQGVRVIERPFTLAEAFAASEAFITSTSANVLPVVMIDTKKIGSGKPGPVTLQLQESYAKHIAKQTGKKL